MSDKVMLIENNWKSLIDSYWFWANQLAMIRNINHSDNWLVNNFINIKGVLSLMPGGVYFCNDIDYRNKMVEFYNCPFLTTYKIPVEPITRKIFHKTIIDLVVESVSKGYYLLFSVNRSYFKNNYSKFSHQILIHGFDLCNKLIFYADNDSITGKYRTDLVCSFKDLKAAFENANLNIDLNEPDLINSVFMFVPTETEYDIDLYKVKKDLKAYLQPRKDVSDTVYGVDVMRAMIQYFKANDMNRDVKGVTVLCDHKKAMLHRMKKIEAYIGTSCKLSKEYTEIVHRSEVLKFLYLKNFFITSNFETGGLINELTKIVEVESQILSEFACEI